MSAPRKIIYLSQDGASLSVGPPRDDDWRRAAQVYHHDDVVQELIDAAGRLINRHEEAAMWSNDMASCDDAIEAVRSAMRNIREGSSHA